MKREDVFKTISNERDYQEENKDKGLHITSELNMGGILSAIRYNLDKANGEWYGETKPYFSTMMTLRKIAALCVMAGEMYDMPERDIKK